MTRDEILKLWPNASESTIQRNLAADYVAPTISHPKPERSSARQNRRKDDRGESASQGRCLVRITSFRARPIDPDNLAGGAKFLIDALRYNRVIRNDSPEDIELAFSQMKVAHRKQEHTLVSITRIPDPTPTEAVQGLAAALSEVQRENAEARKQ